MTFQIGNCPIKQRKKIVPGTPYNSDELLLVAEPMKRRFDSRLAGLKMEPSQNDR